MASDVREIVFSDLHFAEFLKSSVCASPIREGSFGSWVEVRMLSAKMHIGASSIDSGRFFGLCFVVFRTVFRVPFGS